MPATTSLAFKTRMTPTLSILMVNYKTRDLTLASLRTVFAETSATDFELILVDNDSGDGSFEAFEAFQHEEAALLAGRLRLICSDENLGFAKANNMAAEGARGKFLLLLNPDTEVLDGAIDHLMEFALQRPAARIWGGRTVFRDRTLNAASCWNRITPWSAFCMAFGLRAMFPNSSIFNPESMPDFQRDSVRDVDIVVGCFLMISLEDWNTLGGFDLKYFMYGEEADLCLRARALGVQPAITPNATIMHLVGASAPNDVRKETLLTKAKVSLVRDHWSPLTRPFGVLMFLVYAAGKGLRATLKGDPEPSLWSTRGEWIGGYGESPNRA